MRCCCGCYSGFLYRRKKHLLPLLLPNAFLVNGALFSCQLFKVVRRKWHWHVMKVFKGRAFFFYSLSNGKNTAIYIPSLGVLFHGDYYKIYFLFLSYVSLLQLMGYLIKKEQGNLYSLKNNSLFHPCIRVLTASLFL